MEKIFTDTVEIITYGRKQSVLKIICTFPILVNTKAIPSPRIKGTIRKIAIQIKLFFIANKKS